MSVSSVSLGSFVMGRGVLSRRQFARKARPASSRGRLQPAVLNSEPVPHLPCRRRRKESLTFRGNETRYLVSYGQNENCRVAASPFRASHSCRCRSTRGLGPEAIRKAIPLATFVASVVVNFVELINSSEELQRRLRTRFRNQTVSENVKSILPQLLPPRRPKCREGRPGHSDGRICGGAGG